MLEAQSSTHEGISRRHGRHCLASQSPWPALQSVASGQRTTALQVSTASALHVAEASGDIEDSSRVGKGGWGEAS